jgi:hypothetical protein
MSTTRFWNNHHQVHPKPKYFKPNNLKVLEQIKPPKCDISTDMNVDDKVKEKQKGN